MFGKFFRVRKSSAVQYFTLPQCGAVQGLSNGHGTIRLGGYSSSAGQIDIAFFLVFCGTKMLALTRNF